MSAIHKAGAAGPVKTDEQITVDDSERVTIVIEGIVSDLKELDFTSPVTKGSYLPKDYSVERSTLTPSGNGLGRLTLQCVHDQLKDAAAATANRTTYRLTMSAVTYDLIDHPELDSVRSFCSLWLATDEAERFDGTSYSYKDKDGELQAVPSEATKFCAAYMAGIKTFNRYYPVLEKVSFWDNPPGVRKSGNSFSGGSFAKFSVAGTYNTPDIQIDGYDAGGWYKSGDEWVQNEGRDWTRTEQWTYTPEPSNGDHAWIYS